MSATTGSVTRTVGDNDTVQVNQTGPTVFGSNGSNLFDVLSHDLDRPAHQPVGAVGRPDAISTRR